MVGIQGDIPFTHNALLGNIPITHHVLLGNEKVKNLWSIRE